MANYLADYCIIPNCRQIIRYEEGTVSIQCPWCSHHFLTREFKGEQQKVIQEILTGKQAKAALEQTTKEKEALQALLNESQNKWISNVQIQQYIKEKLDVIHDDVKKIHENTTVLKGDTQQLIGGQNQLQETLTSALEGVVDKDDLAQMKNDILQAFHKELKDDILQALRKELRQPPRVQNESAGMVNAVQEALTSALEGVVAKDDLAQMKDDILQALRKEMDQAPRAQNESAGKAKAAQKTATPKDVPKKEKAAPQPVTPKKAPVTDVPYSPVSDFKFTLINNEYRIDKYIGKGETVRIPPAINGVPVTFIGSYAFQKLFGDRRTKSIIVPESVKKVGSYAFTDCHSLESIILPEGLVHLEMGAFAYCSSLQSIELPIGIARIDYQTFQGCYGLKQIVIPDGVTWIGIEAFENCTSLEKVEFPGSLKSITLNAFKGCISLKTVYIREGAKEIPEHAFKKIPSLREVFLPKSIRKIGFFAFDTDPSLLFNVYKNSYAHKWAIEYKRKFCLIDG